MVSTFKVDLHTVPVLRVVWCPAAPVTVAELGAIGPQPHALLMDTKVIKVYSKKINLDF